MSGTTSIAAGSTPAYFSRSAASLARVPEQTTLRRRGATTSQSTSQTQETSRPSAMRSLSANSIEAASAGRMRSTSFAPAGFLISSNTSSAVPTLRRWKRPNAPWKRASPSAITSSGSPRTPARAAAASAFSTL